MPTGIVKKQKGNPSSAIIKTEYQLNVLTLESDNGEWESCDTKKLGTFLGEVKWLKHKYSMFTWTGVWKRKKTDDCNEGIVNVNLDKFYFSSEADLYMALDVHKNSEFKRASDDDLLGCSIAWGGKVTQSDSYYANQRKLGL